MKAFTLLLLASAAALQTVFAESNTNQCLALLGALNGACPQSQLIPSQQCCIAVSNFNKAGCFCNPTMSTLAGESNINLINNLVRPACIVLSVNPLWWLSNIVNKVKWTPVSCSPFQGKTYNGGTCAMNDMQLDNARIGSSVGIGKTIQTYVGQTTCFNYQSFLNDLSMFLDPNPIVTVGFGIGSYTDLDSAVEYLALASPQVNKGFWYFTAPDSATDPAAVLYVIPGGSSIILGATGGGQWWNKCNAGASGYMEQDIQFEGCNTVIKNYLVPGNSALTGAPTNLNNFVNKFYLAAQQTKTWGVEDICSYHETYCTGANKQFASRTECMRFHAALPAISPACGNGLIMSGNSTTCRFKHHFMIPLDPEAHCFHIGYGDRPDKHGKFKCNDAVECVSTSPALSDGNLISLVASASDAQCMANDRNAYTVWQPPTGICPGSIAGRRMLRSDK